MGHERLKLITRSGAERVAPQVPAATRPGWVCVVGGRELPVKDLLVVAANAVATEHPPVGARDFQTAHAIRVLRSLGFEVQRTLPRAPLSDPAPLPDDLGTHVSSGVRLASGRAGGKR